MNQMERSAAGRSKSDPLRMAAIQLENRLETFLLSGAPIPPDLVKSLTRIGGLIQVFTNSSGLNG
jgi:hypothetical protein